VGVGLNHYLTIGRRGQADATSVAGEEQQTSSFPVKLISSSGRSSGRTNASSRFSFCRWRCAAPLSLPSCRNQRDLSRAFRKPIGRRQIVWREGLKHARPPRRRRGCGGLPDRGRSVPQRQGRWRASQSLGAGIGRKKPSLARVETLSWTLGKARRGRLILSRDCDVQYKFVTSWLE
jgi:hypothetical protein